MMQFLIDDLPGVLILSTFFLVLLAVAEAWRRLGRARPEWTRKLVHLAGGLACLAFPFLVSSPWTVLIMALGMSLLFALGGATGILRSLHGVKRRTRGSEYYPLAVFLVFVMARGRPWLYVSSVLVLAVADAFAALIGSRYGRIHYEVEEETKSVEGSLVFLVIAFLAIHLPMLMMTGIPRSVCVLAALYVAVLVTAFEAISLGGTDNLFVPIGVCAILLKITARSADEIMYQNVSMLVISAATGMIVWRARSFNVGGTIAFALFAYGVWSLGSQWWALPVFLGFAVYMAAWFVFPIAKDERSNVKVRIVFRAVIVPFLLLIAANLLDLMSAFYAPFIASLIAVLTFSLWNHILYHRPPARARRRFAALCVATGSWAVLGVIPWAITRGPTSTLLAVGAAAIAVAALNDVLIGREPRFGAEQIWTASRVILTLAAAAAVQLLQGFGAVPAWAP